MDRDDSGSISSLGDGADALRTVFDTLGDAMLVVDTDGRILDANRVARSRYGDDRLGGTPLSAICLRPSTGDFSNGNALDGDLSLRNAALETRLQRAADGTDQTFRWDVRAKDGAVVREDLSLTQVTLDDSPRVIAVARRPADTGEQEGGQQATGRRGTADVATDIQGSDGQETANQVNYERLLERFGIGVWRARADAEGTVLFADETATDILGGDSADEIEHHTIQNLAVDPDSYERLRRRLLEAGTVIDYKIECERRDGEQCWCSVSGTAVTVGGETLFELGIRDVSSQAEHQQTLAQLEDRFEQFASTVRDAFFLVSADYSETLYVNPAVERIYGITPEEAYADPESWLRHVHPDDKEPLVTAVEEFRTGVVEGGLSQQCRIQHPERGQRWIEAQIDVVKDDEGAVEQIAGITTDVTERKQRERELEATTQRLNVALEGTDTGVWEWDLETDEVAWTRSMEQLFGVEPGTFGGTYDAFADYVHPDDLPKLEAAIERTVTTGETLQAEYRIRSQKQGPLWGEARAELVGGEDGSQRLIGIVTDVTERKEQERELRRNRDLIEQTQENAGIGWWEIDLATETLHWSDEVYRIHDLPVGHEVSIDDGIEFYHPDDRPEIQAAFDRLTSEAEPYDLALRLVTAEDRTRWVRTVADPRLDDDGTVVGVLGIFQDITERKEREQTRQQFQKAVEQTAHAVYITDTDGTIEYVNPAFETITGYDAETVIGETPAFLQSGEYDPAFYVDLWETIQAGEQWHTEIKDERADGEEIVLSQTVSPITDEAGDPVKYVAVAEDVSERKAYESELEQARRDLRQIIDLIPDLIFAKNRDGEYLLANEALADHYGETPETVEGSPESAVIPDADQSDDFREDDRAVIDSGEPKRIPEESLTTADGETRILSTVKIPYETASSSEPAVLGYGRDITELKAYERQLETQRDNLDVLNQVVRHDIRNDLQLISAYAEMLDGTLDTESQSHLDVIIRSADNAIELTTTARDLADTMLQADASRRPVPLARTLDAQIDRLLSAEPTTVVSVDGDLPRVDVLADDLLEAVFRNLLKNAVQHNDTEEPEITIETDVGDDTVAVRIADNGPGVSDAHKPQIFGRGEQGLESSGTGIGLYLVDTLLDSYGGDIWVEDNDPRGAVFIIELPLAD